MRRFLPWIIGAVVIFVIYSWVKGINNTAVTLNQNIEESWGNVQTAYQRRNDLIGNLVNTVKGEANFERGTLTDVINARASATQIKVDASDLTPEKMQQYQAAQSGYKEITQTMNYLQIRAPFSGVITRRDAEVGVRSPRDASGGAGSS